jgi:hypothetical protein
LPIARQKGALSDEAAERLEELLSSGGKRGIR